MTKLCTKDSPLTKYLLSRAKRPFVFKKLCLLLLTAWNRINLLDKPTYRQYMNAVVD